MQSHTEPASRQEQGRSWQQRRWMKRKESKARGRLQNKKKNSSSPNTPGWLLAHADLLELDDVWVPKPPEDVDLANRGNRELKWSKNHDTISHTIMANETLSWQSISAQE